MANDVHGAEFSVKEILVRIVLPKLEDIDAKLDAKVDRSEFVQVLDRVSAIELHGSNQAVEALRELNRVQQDVMSIHQELRDRPEQVKRFIEMGGDVDKLKTQRNYLVAGIAVVGSAAFTNLLHIWFGVG